MTRNSRDRVTIELRGMRERLNALAAARKTTVAALARKAIVSLLDVEPSDNQIARNDAVMCDVQIVKVTLRLSAAHATALATHARSADVSQGDYVAGLIDGMPPNPLPPDHKHAVAALVGSTNQIAAVGADLNAFMRLLVRGSARSRSASGSPLRSRCTRLAEHPQKMHVASARESP